MSENIREIVLDTLLTLEREEEFSNRLIKAVLDKYDYLSFQEKSFIKRVAEGTIERQIELDYYLNHISSVPVRKMKPLIRCLLRMSAYQILYMNAIPDSAACNEACKLADKRKFHNLKGFVNAVLRKLTTEKEALPLPDREKEPALFLSVKYSMPEWLVERWLFEYGSHITETLLEGLLQIHQVSLRFSMKLSEEEREKYLSAITEQKRAEGQNTVIRQSTYLPYVYTVDNIDGIETLPGFSEGVFTVQDVSSALAVEAAGISAGDFVVDVCAAPGGKSLLAAERAGRVLARDVSEAKCAMIEENIERMKADNVTVQVYDATRQDGGLTEQADVVLLDVPCSGLGVIGKKRDIKYRVSEESLAEITALQRRIVENSWQYVKKGGILLYSTCTINRAENEDMVQWILDNFPFRAEPVWEYLPKRLLAERKRVCSLLANAGSDAVKQYLSGEVQEACVQLLPGYMEADGFFFARLRRS